MGKNNNNTIPKRGFKMDKYHSMKELQNETIENEDWEIITEDRDSNVTILAIHGGGIEPATTELARVIANDGQFNYFAFNGMRTKGNNELHVTSINYDNDIAMDLVKQVKVQSQFMDVLVKMKLLISVVKWVLLKRQFKAI